MLQFSSKKYMNIHLSVYYDFKISKHSLSIYSMQINKQILLAAQEANTRKYSAPSAISVADVKLFVHQYEKGSSH